MATVLGIKAGKTGISAEVKKRKGLGNYAETGYSMTFEVEADSLNEKWTDVLGSPQLPQIGKAFEGDECLRGDEIPDCRCTKVDLSDVSISMRNGIPRLIWELKYSFSSEASEMAGAGGIGGGVGGSRDPQEWPLEISWRSGTAQEQLLTDRVDASDVVNSVGEPIFLEAEVPCAILVLRRYEPAHHVPAKILKFLKKTNSKMFLDYGPGHCLIEDISGELEVIHGKPYFHMTYQILIRDDSDQPFTVTVLDQGTKARAGEDGEIQTTAEILGRNCTVNLNSDGTINETESPNTRTFHIYGEVDFAELKLTWPDYSASTEDEVNAQIPEGDNSFDDGEDEEENGGIVFPE